MRHPGRSPDRRNVGGAMDASVTLAIGATARTIFKPIGQRAYA